MTGSESGISFMTTIIEDAARDISVQKIDGYDFITEYLDLKGLLMPDNWFIHQIIGCFVVLGVKKLF